MKSKASPSPDPNGTKLSPEGATSNSPRQASAPPWVLEKEGLCPEWAASQTRLNLVPFSPDPQITADAAYIPVAMGEMGAVYARKCRAGRSRRCSTARTGAGRLPTDKTRDRHSALRG